MGCGAAVGLSGAVFRCGAFSRKFCAPVLSGVSFGGGFRGFGAVGMPSISREERQGGVFLFGVYLYPCKINVDCGASTREILVYIDFRVLEIFNNGILPIMWG